ncbi:MAG: hypothetical protein ABJR05_14985 [Balneola sp.]
MKRKSLFIIFFILGCASAKQTEKIEGKNFSQSELYQIQNKLSAVLDSTSNNTASLPEYFYPEIKEVDLDYYRKSLIKNTYPSTPDSVFQLALNNVENDFKSGKFIFKTYGLGTILTLEDGSKWDIQRVKKDLFFERYGIVVDPIAGDLVNDQLRLYAKTYNSVSKTVMNWFYGRDISKEANETIIEYIMKQGNARPEWRVKSKTA